jgi:hypothetical protein
MSSALSNPCQNRVVPALQAKDRTTLERCLFTIKHYEKYLLGGAPIQGVGLVDPRHVRRQALLLDDELLVGGALNQAQVPKALHKRADPRPRRADHLGQLRMGNLRDDPDAARIVMAELMGEV